MTDDGTRWGVYNIDRKAIMATYSTEEEAKAHDPNNPTAWRVQKLTDPMTTFPLRIPITVGHVPASYSRLLNVDADLLLHGDGTVTWDVVKYTHERADHDDR